MVSSTGAMAMPCRSSTHTFGFRFWPTFSTPGSSSRDFSLSSTISSGSWSGSSALPPSPAKAVQELSDYDWRSDEARQKYDQISDLLGREMLDQRFAGMKQAMENATDTTQDPDKRLKDLSTYFIDTRNSADADRLKDYSDDLRDVLSRIADDQVKAATAKADAQDFVSAAALKEKADRTK